MQKYFNFLVCYSFVLNSYFILTIKKGFRVCRTLHFKVGDYLLSHFRSTIGAGGLNFSVRNGKRWNPVAIVTLRSCEVRSPESGVRSPKSEDTLHFFRLPTSDFRLPTSVFRLRSSIFGLPSSVFRLPSSDFRLPTSDFRLPSSVFRLSHSPLSVQSPAL